MSTLVATINIKKKKISVESKKNQSSLAMLGSAHPEPENDNTKLTKNSFIPTNQQPASIQAHQNHGENPCPSYSIPKSIYI